MEIKEDFIISVYPNPISTLVDIGAVRMSQSDTSCFKPNMLDNKISHSHNVAVVAFNAMLDCFANCWWRESLHGFFRANLGENNAIYNALREMSAMNLIDCRHFDLTYYSIIKRREATEVSNRAKKQKAILTMFDLDSEKMLLAYAPDSRDEDRRVMSQIRKKNGIPIEEDPRILLRYFDSKDVEKLYSMHVMPLILHS